MALPASEAIGKRFSRLLVVSVTTGVRNSIAHCVCDCGQNHSALVNHLRTARTTSCGCAKRQNAKARFTTHGHSKSAEYRAWQSMKDRCYNEHNVAYKNYGGRGVTVYEPWRSDFGAFLAHIGDMPTPGLEIERKHNNGNYEPGNVLWATVIQQARNKRTSRNIEYNGQIKTAAGWEEITGIKSATIRARLRLGWNVEDALKRIVAY